MKHEQSYISASIDCNGVVEITYISTDDPQRFVQRLVILKDDLFQIVDHINNKGIK